MCCSGHLKDVSCSDRRVFCAVFSVLSLLRRRDVERRLLAAVPVRQEHNTANVRIGTAMLPALGIFLVK